MKIFILIFILFSFTNVFGQITIDTTIKQQYDSIYKLLPIYLRQNIARTEKDIENLNERMSKETNNNNFRTSNLCSFNNTSSRHFKQKRI